MRSIFDKVISGSDEEFQLLRQKAGELTLQHFGRKRSLFNPLYISDICVNHCAYCGFRKSNRDFSRTTLTSEQIISEVEFILSRGIRNILLLSGEYGQPAYMRMLLAAIRLIKEKFPDIWLGLESAPLEVEDYRVLNGSGLDSVVLFQETYSKPVYKQYHGSVGPKANYRYRREALARAVQGGVTEIGLGVLFGLADPVQEVQEMYNHAAELLQLNPNIQLRFSFPRIQLAKGQDKAEFIRVSEEILRKLIVATRLTFPAAKIVLTARETQEFRLGLFDIVTDTGEGGSTAVGGYTINKNNQLSQFILPGVGVLGKFKKQMAVQGYVIQ